MICENCGKRESTVLYSENINGKKRELHLCEECSKELGIDDMSFNMPIDFSSFFSGILEEFENTDIMPMFDTVKELECKSCGYTIEDILNTGKFGCANCYDTFEKRLSPIIRKIQGSNQHIGRLGKITEHKVDSNSDKIKKTVKKDEIESLKEDLKQAVKEERYEDAAKIRDEIAKKESKRKKKEE